MKERIEELAVKAYADWVNVTCVGDCSEKYTEIIGGAISSAVNEALETAANTCEDQSVWADTYKCAAAIRKLKV